ncbi:MAG TPA: NUDIX domain-containing protein [Candidatus Saccharimonadia bacterium]
MSTNQKKNHKHLKQKRPPRLKAIREYTAGGMVFRRRGAGKIDILMIQDRKGRWTIPKGHVEEGESFEETATREISEETGLKHLVIRDKLDKIFFFYRREGSLIYMTTHIFLIEALSDTDALVPEDSEGIVDVKWFNTEEALKTIEYKDTEQLFKLGLEKLKVS